MCLDNGAFSNFCPDAYQGMLRRWSGSPIPVEWITYPDAVGNAMLTNVMFHQWRSILDDSEKMGWIDKFKYAFVAQDGVEDLELPWRHFKCLFIGGTTDWKLSRHIEGIIKEAKRRGKTVHMGRVNSQKRMRYAFQLGCDSVDGTGYSKYNKKDLLRALQYVDSMHHQQQQFLDF